MSLWVAHAGILVTAQDRVTHALFNVPVATMVRPSETKSVEAENRH